LTLEVGNSLITAISVEEYKLNFSDLTKNILQPSITYLLELNLRSTQIVSSECT
jgi:hypothetical protein